MNRIYLDHNATTAVDPAVLARVRRHRKRMRTYLLVSYLGYLLTFIGEVKSWSRSNWISWALAVLLVIGIPVLALMFHVERSYRRVGL